MAIQNLVRLANLSGDFLLDVTAQVMRVNIDGTTIRRNGAGQLEAVPSPSISVTEIAMCIDDGAGGALKVIRRATFTDGVQTALVYIDADDNVTEHPFTSIVDCCL